jgi:hypothetical protein
MMSNLRKCLSAPEIKDLVNSCIDGTIHQKESIEFKRGRTSELQDLRGVGKSRHELCKIIYEEMGTQNQQ